VRTVPRQRKLVAFGPMPTRAPLPALALLAAAACAPAAHTLRTEYRAALAVESPSAALACELPAELAYGKVERVTERGDGSFSGVEVRERWAPLPLRVLNRTGELLTVDWERSVFVDATGLSRRVRVFPSGQVREGPSTEAGPLDHPSPAVVAPGTRVEAFVLPEPTPPAPALFFLPPNAPERAPLRLVVSAPSATGHTAECVITAAIASTRVERDASARWPGHGERCIPALGCAEGLSCLGDVCIDPKGPPLPPGYRATPARKRLFGESCEKDDDCVQGYQCDRRMGICG